MSVFILMKYEVFIVCGYRVVMLSVMKYKIFVSLPLKKNPQQQSISLLSFLLSFVSRLLAAAVCCL